ncbi:hypothetical protein [Massilia endophytica]|uniref:hypothetical protein n=1 Tax=Massilia endophytica TaxID=2899220 RepID=UPI001E5BF89D|nr:hypothetical protein [Massilia endophytica]UGQ46562.1 hypothetical protein LSQ66_22805 [Massilia endophytica]
MKALFFAGCLAAAGGAVASPCLERLVPYGAAIPAPEYRLELGGLVYLGAQHSSDPGEAQFADIEKRWNAMKPDVAFYEGPNRPVPANREEAIRQTGESGFVRYLAARDGVALARLEPEPKDEAAWLLQRFTPEQVSLFYTLREAARLRERRSMDEEAITMAIGQMLERAAGMGLPISFRSTAEVAAAYRRYWTEPAQWWQAPSRWFDPRARSADTGGIFTNEVNAQSSAFRNVNMVNRLSAAVREGKKVFAVVGRDHVSHQADALRCSIATP